MEKIKNIVAGAFLRPWLRKTLGKDWFNSLTVWGLVVYGAAQAGAQAACDLGALSTSDCYTASLWVENFGKALMILGVRRAAISKP